MRFVKPWNPGWYYHSETGNLYREPDTETQMKLYVCGRWGDVLPRRQRAKPLTRRALRRIDPERRRKDLQAIRYTRMLQRVGLAAQKWVEGDVAGAARQMALARFMAKKVQ